MNQQDAKRLRDSLKTSLNSLKVISESLPKIQNDFLKSATDEQKIEYFRKAQENNMPDMLKEMHAKSQIIREKYANLSRE